MSRKSPKSIFRVPDLASQYNRSQPLHRDSVTIEKPLLPSSRKKPSILLTLSLNSFQGTASLILTQPFSSSAPLYPFSALTTLYTSSTLGPQHLHLPIFWHPSQIWQRRQRLHWQGETRC
ncbi:hypothetical protein ACMFMF_007783 [Clarireedia jacksonii]